MSIQNLLQQMLSSGQQAGQSAGTQLNELGRKTGLGGFGGGALAGGALGLLLGNKKFRKMGGKVATYGAAAALGAVALKAYQDWQTQRSSGSAPTPSPQTTQTTPAANASPAALGWSEGETEAHSKAVLIAMIGAAKADGHIGDSERVLLEAEVARLGNAEDQAWFHAEIEKPADPASVAQLADTPEKAAEMYLASLLVIDDQSFMERAYLDELARQLKLEPGLKNNLENQIQNLA
ncbi:MAG: hypothetical protein CML17_12785 [Pusillimonas sp.]|nr:hypothetical protein [Pusillimonas sp.]